MNMVYSFSRQVVRGVIEYQQLHEPWEICTNPQLGFDALGAVREFRGDGLIASRGLAEEALNAHRNGVPLVLASCVPDLAHLPAAHTDDQAIGRLAAEHFQDLGLQQFAAVSESVGEYATRRVKAFQQALGSQRSAIPVYEVASSFQMDHTQQDALRRWLEGLPHPVGVFVTNDARGVAVIRACGEAGLAVPDDVAVLGVDNDEFLCNSIRPALSSIDINAALIGHEAAALLDRLMQGRTVTDTPVRVPPSGVIQRQSTDTLAVNDPIVKQAIRAIRQRVADNLRASDVAAEVGMSNKGLYLRFRKALGHTVKEEIRQARIARLRKLLRETALPMSRVAAAAGFSDQSKMGVAFRRATGQTPTAYRSQFRVE
jgi:LacI family transcriptional regulator